MRLARPTFSRSDSPRRNSDFWDFDILDPKITINRDTAVVECELVLWGAPPDGATHGPGRKINEMLVFVSPSPPTVNSTPTDGNLWPLSSAGPDPKNSRRSWKLARFDKIYEFLNRETKKSDVHKNEVEELK